MSTSGNIPASLVVLTIDDHALIRSALREVLGLMTGRVDLLEAATPPEGLGLLQSRHDVDLVLLDLNFAEHDGLEFIDRIRAAAPAAPLIVYTMHEDVATLKAALAHGAAGIVPKTHSARLLQRAIELVMEGGMYVPSDLARQLAAPSEASLAVQARPQPAAMENPRAARAGLPQQGDRAGSGRRAEHSEEPADRGVRQVGGLQSHPGRHCCARAPAPEKQAPGPLIPATGTVRPASRLPTMPRMDVLLVEGRPAALRLLSRIARRALGDARIRTACTLAEGLEQAREAPQLGLVVLDLELPGCRRIDALMRFVMEFPLAKVVVVSGAEADQHKPAALAAGAAAYVPKSASPFAMAATLRSLRC